MRPLQARAQLTRAALLAAGRDLLADRDFDSMPVADLAARAASSVGSFYGRFRDKDAFFVELQEQITGEWLEAAADLLRQCRDRGTAPATVVRRLAGLVVGLARRDAGFLRAALRHACASPESWTPIRQAGGRLSTELVAALAPLLVQIPKARREARIRFAMQMVYGTCVNAVLNDPGPLRLADTALERELATVMCLYLDIDASGTTRRQPALARPRAPGLAAQARAGRARAKLPSTHP